MAATTSLDASHQYWSSINFPPSPSVSPAPSSRASRPGASPQLPIPNSAPPSPSPSPPPYSVHANDRLASSLNLHKQQFMPAGTATSTTTTTTTLLDSSPSRSPKHQRPPVPHKPTALRLTSRQSTTRSSSATGWRRVMNSGFTWIGLYFIFNMGLTLYKKTVLVHFPFPYSLTALHTLCGTIGCIWLRRIGYFTPARLTVRQNLTLAAFSVLYTLNIAIPSAASYRALPPSRSRLRTLLHHPRRLQDANDFSESELRNF